MVYYVLFPVYKSTYNKTPVLYINYGYVYPNHRKHMCFFKKDTCFSIKPHVLFLYAKNTGDKAYKKQELISKIDYTLFLLVIL